MALWRAINADSIDRLCPVSALLDGGEGVPSRIGASIALPLRNILVVLSPVRVQDDRWLSMWKQPATRGASSDAPQNRGRRRRPIPFSLHPSANAWFSV